MILLLVGVSLLAAISQSADPPLKANGFESDPTPRSTLLLAPLQDSEMLPNSFLHQTTQSNNKEYVRQRYHTI